jgi:hypothetical protein
MGPNGYNIDKHEDSHFRESNPYSSIVQTQWECHEIIEPPSLVVSWIGFEPSINSLLYIFEIILSWIGLKMIELNFTQFAEKAASAHKVKDAWPN